MSDSNSITAPHLLERAGIRARFRPRTIALVWLWELAGALVLATPIHAWALRMWGSHPDGDSVLFRPGGASLLTWLGGDEAAAALTIVSRTTVVDFVFLLLFGQLVIGALVASLATAVGDDDRPPPMAFALRVGLSSFAPLLGTTLLFGSVQIFLIGVGIAASSATDHAIQPSFGEARALTARIVVLVLFGAAVLAIGVVADLARVAIARSVATNASYRVFRGGVVSALRTAREAFFRACFGWGWRASVSLALLYLAWHENAWLDNGQNLLWVLWIVHQAIAFARVGLRASWLARALGLVTRYDVV